MFPKSVEVCTVTKRSFSLARRLYGKCMGAHQVDSERHHFLPTQHVQQGQGWCASSLQGERPRERSSVFVSATSSDETGWHALWDCFSVLSLSLLYVSLFYPKADVQFYTVLILLRIINPFALLAISLGV